MRAALLIFAFGGAGSVLRHLVNLSVLRLTGIAFPWGILVINVLGCLAIGLFARIIPLNAGWGPEVRLALMTGLCGGFTTFSAFSLDVADLWLRGSAGYALAYVGASLVLCLGAVALGLAAGSALST